MRIAWLFQATRNAHLSNAMIKLISWNLLRLTGASLDDIVRLIRREQPDLLLMQEATQEMDGLTTRVGGQYQRNLLPGRVHGLAVWSPIPLQSLPVVLPLQAGAMFNRICQIVEVGPLTVANVICRTDKSSIAGSFAGSPVSCLTARRWSAITI
jgi:endonuclease/exonuclease/phosphatase (EEP) superfamily protein YafD